MSSLKRTPLTDCTTVYVSSPCYTGCSVAARRRMVPSVLFSTALYGVSMLSNGMFIVMRTVCARWEPWLEQCLETWRSTQIGNSVSCTYRPMCTSRHSTFCAHSIGMGFISWSQYKRTTYVLLSVPITGRCVPPAQWLASAAPELTNNTVQG